MFVFLTEGERQFLVEEMDAAQDYHADNHDQTKYQQAQNLNAGLEQPHQDLIFNDYKLSWLGEAWGIFNQVGTFLAYGPEVLPYLDNLLEEGVITITEYAHCVTKQDISDCHLVKNEDDQFALFRGDELLADGADLIREKLADLYKLRLLTLTDLYDLLEQLNS